MSTVLVTGGAGFIGSRLCGRMLAEGKRVVAIDDLSTGRIANISDSREYGPRFTFYNVAVNAEGLTGLFERHAPDVVMHLADLTERNTPPTAAAEVGTIGLLNVLEASARAGVKKLVFASGWSIYGEARRFPVKETALWGARPLTPTAIAKRHAEDHLRYYERYRGLAFTSLVLGTVYGPHQDPLAGGVVGAMTARLLLGEPAIVTGDGNQTRDFVFVDDAVHAFSLAADRGEGRTLNIGTGVESSVNGVLRMLCGITQFSEPPQTGPLPTGEVRRSVLDNEAAERELGWKPWTHLEDGLRETVAYLRSTLPG